MNHSFTRVARGVATKLTLGMFTLAAMLVACGGDTSSAYDQPEVVGVNNKTVSGVSQKGPFVTGSAVKLYELDGTTYAQTGKSFTGKIASDDGKFSVASVTLASQYALLEANGYFRNEVSGTKSSGTISLNALTDLSDREKVNINLLTHLEYERALYLIGTGINVPSAKKQAEAEIFNAFGIQGEFANSEDLDIFSSGDGNAALLAFSVLMLRDLSEADLTELLTKFAIDIEKDGSWDDEATKTNIADWAQETDLAGDLAAIRSNVEGWNLGTVPDFEKYVRNFWYVNYGLGECGSTNEGEVVATKNELSTTYGSQMRFICKSGVWQTAQEIDHDTYGEKCTSAEVGSIISGKVTETNKYYCSETGWISLMGWSWDIPKEVRLNPDITYGTMTDSRDGKSYKTVTIGTQTWMAENLNYADSVTTASLKGKSLCFKNVAKNCDLAGRLYTWAAAIDSVKLANDGRNSLDCGYGKTCGLSGTVQGICPSGWHLPSRDEWDTLITAVGGSSTAGAALKSTSGWSSYEGVSGNGTDAFGFSALPAGSWPSSEGVDAYFWSSTEFDSYYAYSMYLLDDYDYAYLVSDSKFSRFSVRCLKD
ncbi:MAG: fibrobacter succinogenes major paralogous domain-containing protein [Fibrobacter sp.]|nr:fibrobacter succinogenes major paralogous domain-containing protein [Fibrobacter sp.]MDY6369823.1 fibrobacter succinogenes major paralogous domain-containing protein [Fibrobacter sp.]MDY6390267.1 fibrobacter succinogenes major paralogous domain-containing protein [Fibrobacter sp.]